MNYSIFAILCLILVFSVKGSISHFKGEGSCCGGGSKDIKAKRQKLKCIKSTKVVKIDGMHCEHCYTRVHNVLNSIDGINATVYGKKGKAVIKSDHDIEDAFIVGTIEKLGYTVVSVEEKRL